jgi:YHYH protein
MKQYLIFRTLTATLSLFLVLSACDSSSIEDDLEINSTANISGDVPAIFERFYNDVTVYQDGDVIIVESKGMPDHSSPYFDDSRYEAYDGTNSSFRLNPNRIREQQFVFRIPTTPTESSNKSSTQLGPIGVALNGVAIYNQYAGPNQPLTNEINSFDQYNGHPQQSGQYHYHVEPLHLTESFGESALIGFLLDGFPVYGPVENGVDVQNSDLDVYHGHTGPTEDFEDGIYHYHITSQDPYINGSGYFGIPGTVSQ